MTNVPDNKNRRVLVIDDNRSIHEDFRKILSPPAATGSAVEDSEMALFGDPAGAVGPPQFEMDSAYQGQEGAMLVGKAMAEGRPYAMAFVDVRMPPGWDGIETTHKIWELDPELQIVICTAYADYSWGEMFDKIGNRDGLLILKKPFDAVEALQLAHALTEKWWLHRESARKMGELEAMVAERTRELCQANDTLQSEVIDHTRVEGELRLQTAFLEAQVNSSVDGILVVNDQGRKMLQNRRMGDLMNIPPDIADDIDDSRQLRWVTGIVKDSAQFIERVLHLNSHRDEISRDEIELLNGTLLDRYSSPVVGRDGGYYGRIWTFRDVTDQRRIERELKEARIATVLRESTQRYHFLADTVPLIIWTARPDGCLDYYNQTWFDYTGLTLAQTRDWGWGAVLHPDDLQPCIERWTRSFTTGENYEIEYRFKRAVDGAYRWFLGRASAHRDEAGQIMQWVGTCTDIEDQKHAESELRQAQATLEGKVAERTAELAETNEALQRQHAELRVLFDLTPAMIWFKDTKNRILRVNQRVAESAGRTVGEIEGKPALEIYPGEAGRFYADDLEVIHSGLPKLEQVEMIPDPAGRELWVQTDKVPYRDQEGNVIGIVVMAQDISERKRSETALRESEEKFRQLAENITDVFWITSPDMRMIHYVSPAYEQIWGRSVDSLYADPHQWVEAILPEERGRVLAVFKTLMEDAPGVSVEYPVARPDGTVRWVHDRGFQIRDAGGGLIRLTGTVTDITDRKRAEESLRMLSSAVEQSKESIIITDAELDLPGPRILFVNPAFTKMTGYTAEEAIGKTPRILQGPRTDKTVLSRLRHDLERGGAFEGEAVNYRRDGTEFDLEWQIAPIRDASGKITHFVAIQRDVTERNRLDARLLQSQKLETVGKLAGGIAHEFNSILTAIIGQSELLLGELPVGSPPAKKATEISRAAGRAATLTRQLLAYGRKQFLQPETINLNQVITGMESMLRYLTGGDINLRIISAAGLKSVRADAGQIEQVIMNLAINAREAMPGGGRLILETANIALDQETAGGYPELKPGGYVVLTITDTGVGMSAEVRAMAFEPFFTTKAVGQGTGLGLSTCYGIIKQSGGHISVDSEPGRGTSFKIYLPQVEPRVVTPVPRPNPPDLPRGTEAILLVEDNPSLREMAATLLGRLGYTVWAVANGIDALGLARRHETGHIDLVFTDIVMPGMSGRELAGLVSALYPRTKILFASAHTEKAVASGGGLNHAAAFLQKPFTPSAMARKIRDVLDQPPPG